MVAAAIVAGAAISAVGSYAASSNSASAAKKAANTQAGAANAANAEQQREFDINQQNQAPWLKTGTSAINALGNLYGLNGGSADKGYQQFLNSPTYQWSQQQGMANLDKSAAARGNLYSGGYGTDLVNFNQGLASQQFQNYSNALAGIAGVGQTAANNLGYAGQNFANAYGNNLNTAAQATASGYLGRANAMNQGINGMVGGFNQLAGYYGNNGGFGSGSSYGYSTGGSGITTGNYLDNSAYTGTYAGLTG